MCVVNHFERFEEVGCDEGSYVRESSILNRGNSGARVDGGRGCG